MSKTKNFKGLLQIRLDEKAMQQLDKLSEQTRLNKSAIVRNLIHQAAERVVYQPLTLEKTPSNNTN